MHTDITCVLCHARFPYPSFSALNPALERSRNLSLDPTPSLGMSPAVLRTVVDFFLSHVLFLTRVPIRWPAEFFLVTILTLSRFSPTPTILPYF